MVASERMTGATSFRASRYVRTELTVLPSKQTPPASKKVWTDDDVADLRDHSAISGGGADWEEGCEPLAELD